MKATPDDLGGELRAYLCAECSRRWVFGYVEGVQTVIQSAPAKRCCDGARVRLPESWHVPSGLEAIESFVAVER